jgi:RND family efflux transporter MFP subunit
MDNVTLQRNSTRVSGLFVIMLAVALGSCTKKPDKASLPDQAPPVTDAARTAAPEANKSSAPSPVDVVSGPPDTALTANASPEAAAANLAATNKKEAPAVSATPAESGRSSSSRISGQVTSLQQGQVGFKVQGHIEKILVRVGDRVQRGQRLAQLDSTDYALRARIADGQIELAKVSLEQARRDLERENELKREGATTELSFERASNLLTNSRIALGSAELQQKQAKKALDDTFLLAAYDGVVSKRFKSEGEYVAVGAPVFELSAVDNLEVSLRVPESFLRKIKIGQVVPLNIPSINKRTTVKIDRLVPVIQETTRTFEVIGKFEKPDGSAVPGQFVEAELAE